MWFIGDQSAFQKILGRKKGSIFHIHMENPALSRVKWGFFLEDYLDILITYTADLQEGMDVVWSIRSRNSSPLQVRPSLSLFFLYFYFCYYYRCPHVPISPHFAYLHPTPAPPSHWPSLYCCLCLWLIYIYVLWLIPSPSFIHASVSILFISLFCSLDSMYKWGHMVFVLLWLAYFT